MAQLFVHPGGVDLHDHFREPSEVNLSENFESGTRAAAVGGWVITNDMPNTPKRETWTVARLDEKQHCITQGAIIPVGIIAGMQPEANNIDELLGMSSRSTAAKQYYTVTQGNDLELGPNDFREQTAMWHSVDPTKPIMVHPGEDIEGIIGMVAGDYQHPLHFCHVNDPNTIRLIEAGRKKYDTQITSGVTPHHLFKSSFDVRTEGWFARMMPPLADQTDSEQLMYELAAGNIDVVETDHAPHPKEANWNAEHKNPSCDEGGASCYGVTNIEFALPLLFYQERLGRITMKRIIDATSTKPAQIIGVSLSSHTKVEWDLTHDYRIAEDDVVSGSGWTPFAGKLAVGKVVNMQVRGKQIINNSEFVGRFPKVVYRADVY